LSESDDNLPPDCLSEHDLEEEMCTSHHGDIRVETVVEDNTDSDSHSHYTDDDNAEAEPHEQQLPHTSYPFQKNLHYHMCKKGKYHKFVENSSWEIGKSLEDYSKESIKRKNDERLVALNPMRAVRAALKSMGMEQREVLNIFENMAILYMKLSRDKTWGDITLTLALYAKTFTRESFLAIATESLLGILRDDDTALQPQSGEPAPSWLRVFARREH
jgi:hypothetical protein